MGIEEKYVAQAYHVECKGRDRNRNEVLVKPVAARVIISQHKDSDILTSRVDCPHATGGHGQNCKALRPKSDKIGEGIVCAYSFDIPYDLEKRDKVLRHY